jgi:hypothetical protein
VELIEPDSIAILQASGGSGGAFGKRSSLVIFDYLADGIVVCADPVPLRKVFVQHPSLAPVATRGETVEGRATKSHRPLF